MTRKQRRLVMIAAALGVLGLAAVLVLGALKDSIVFFNSPSDVQAKQIAPGTRIRIGGLVQPGSVVRTEGVQVRFAVTDGNATLPVTYKGILPDLFREGQGVVAEGSMGDDGKFVATNVLAKHDENYIPKEVVDALKAQGEWRPEGGAQ